MNLLRHQLRALFILRSLEKGAMYPVPIEVVHTVAYLCDALAPIWKLIPLQDSVLKTMWIPRQPALQRALDRLVGSGMVSASNVGFVTEGSKHRLRADYSINDQLCSRLFAVVDADTDWRWELDAVREIATCVAGMGRESVPRAVLVDASYGDPMLDNNTVLDLEPDPGAPPTRTQIANKELSSIALEHMGHGLTPAELTRLYVRHLYSLTESRT